MTALPLVPGIELSHIIGTGGMGAVYAGVDTNSGRPVAVKILPAGACTRAARQRFDREANAMLRLQHKHICRAYTYGALADGSLFLAMERLRGEDLSSRLQRVGRLPFPEAIAIAAEAAEGLAAAHRAGLIHRDVKPSNLFLHETPAGRIVRVLDFGLAVFTEAESRDSRVTTTGEVLGTPAYMAPEQARGDKSEDARTDVWGLGAVLYHMVGGRPPFGRGAVVEVMLRLLSERPLPLGQVRVGTPPALVSLVDDMLRRDADTRPPTMSAVLARLSAVPVEGGSAEETRVAPVEKQSLASENRVLTVVLGNSASDVETVAGVIRRHGGQATVIGGGQVAGVFGGEAREGDEAVRAVRAAIDMRPYCSVVGVGTGRATGGNGFYSGEALDAAEEATRVTSPGVYLDEETRRRVSERMPLDEVDSSDHTMVAAPTESPFLGRDLEVTDLRSRVLRAWDDEEPAWLLVTGPPGIGKSRLVRVAAQVLGDDRPEASIVRGSADQAGRYVGWSLIGAALRSHASLHDDAEHAAVREQFALMVADAGLEADVGALLAATLGVPLRAGESDALDAALTDASVMRDQIVGAVGDYLAAVADRGPLAIVLEDVHRADTPSLELIDVLLHRLDGYPFAIVMTGRQHARRERPELFDAPELVQIGLGELPKKAAVQLAESLLVSTRVAEQVAAHAGGNPLFIEEIARVAAMSGDREFSSDRFRMPLTVEEALQSRLDYLGDGDKDVLKCASVYGESFFGEGLDAFGVTDVAGSLKRLECEGLVRRARGMRRGAQTAHRFRSAVVRDAVYAMLTGTQLRRLHSIAAEWLESSPFGTPAAVAYHLTASGDPEAAVPRWLDASDAARRGGDLRDAVDCLERALPTVVGTRHERSVRLRRLELFASMADLKRAQAEVTALTPLMEGATDAERADLVYWTAAVDQWKGLYESSRGGFSRAAGMYEALGRTFRLSRALAAEAVQICTGRLGPAEPLARRAVEVAGDDAMARARALHTLQYVLGYEGSLSGARAAGVDALEACEKAGDVARSVEVMTTLAAHDLEVGRFEGAATRLQSIVSRAQRIGNRNAEGYALHNLGVVKLRTGDFDEALSLQERAALIGKELSQARLEGAARYFEALTRLARGADGAVEDARAGSEMALQLTIGSTEEASARTVRAMVHLEAGEVAAGLKQVEQARALRDQGGMFDLEAELMACEVDLLLAAGRFDEAQTRLAEGQALLMTRVSAVATNEMERQAFYDASPAHRRLLTHDTVAVPSDDTH